jgi:hypothetical protein
VGLGPPTAGRDAAYALNFPPIPSPGSAMETQPMPRFPSLAQHLRELPTRPGASLVIVRNLIPIAGIFAFGWSASVVTFNYWFDGFVAMSALIAAMLPRAISETPTAKAGPVVYAATIFATWIFLVGLLGIPYWIVLIPLHDVFFGDELRTQLATSHSLWIGIAIIVLTYAFKAYRSGFSAMPEDEMKQRARWDFYLLVLRALAMFEIASWGFAIVVVPVMALVLTYLEIWPERALGAVFGDPSRLYTIVPGGGRRRPDKRS